MIFFPGNSEILILPLSRDQIQRKLLHALTLKKNDPSKKFIGWIKGDAFQISKSLNRPDNYTPLIIGSIECSSKDCIIFLKYRLMFSTKMFLSFWTIILLFLSLFFIVKYEENLYGIISLGLGMINYLVVYVNFRKQVRISHMVFLEMMEESFQN